MEIVHYLIFLIITNFNYKDKDEKSDTVKLGDAGVDGLGLVSQEVECLKFGSLRTNG